MKCPVDETVLAISERRGIEIDYCPQCRGVWLDRGELDKLIERAADEVPEPPRRDDRPDDRRDDDRRDDDRRDDVRDHDRPRQDSGYRKKKKSFLSEFLEFGD